MKKSKILSIVLGMALIFVIALTLFACKEKCTSHIDENGDKKCDKCGAEMITDDGNGGGTEEDKDTYTFTLKDQYAGGVRGASVQVYVNGKAGDTKVTNAQGVVEFKVAKDAVLVQVKVTAIEDPVYRMNLDKTYTIENGKSLICNDVIKQDKFVITVIDTSGEAVVGAMVQLCSGGTCKPPVATNGNGQAIIYASGDNSDAYISFNSLPAGYALQNGGKYNDGLEEDYAHYTDFNSDKTIEIVVDKLEETIVQVDGHFISSTFADIQIDMYDKKTGAYVASEITNAEGVAVFHTEYFICRTLGKFHCEAKIDSL